MAYIQLSDIGITGVVTAVPKNKINNNDLTTEFGEKHIHKFIKTTGVQNIRRQLIWAWQRLMNCYSKKVFHKRRLVRWYLLPMVRIIKDRQRHMCCRRDFVCRNIVPALIFLSDVLHLCMEHKY